MRQKLNIVFTEKYFSILEYFIPTDHTVEYTVKYNLNVEVPFPLPQKQIYYNTHP